MLVCLIHDQTDVLSVLIFGTGALCSYKGQILQILLRVRYNILFLQSLLIDWTWDTLAPLSEHCAWLLLILLVLQPNDSRVAWVWIDRRLRGIPVIFLWLLGVWKLPQALGLVCLLNLPIFKHPACIVVLFSFIAAILDPHLLLATLIWLLRRLLALFSLYFLLVFMFVVLHHISE